MLIVGCFVTAVGFIAKSESSPLPQRSPCIRVDLADVIKINSYVVDLDSERSKALSQAKAKYFTQTDQPASTVIGISALVMKQLQVEIEATAVIEV